LKGVGRVPKGPMMQIIRENTETYTLYEQSGSTSSYAGTEYVDNGKTADLYLFSPQDITEIVISGEQDGGSLQGLCLPDQDISEGDRVNYGQGRYEVENITPMPDATNPDIYELALTQVVESGLQS